MKAINNCTVITDKNQKELYSHVEPLFPCTVYTTNFASRVSSEIPWHWHQDLELILVTEGSLLIDLGKTSFILEKEQLLFLNTSVLHFMKQASSQNCTAITIVFDAELVSGHVESIYKKQYILPLLTCHNLHYIIFSSETAWQKKCIDCFQKACTLFVEETPAFLFAIREQLSYICYEIVENCQTELTTPSVYPTVEYQRIKQLLEYIHTHYHESISLKTLSTAVNISQRECFRCFQTILHTTPMAYITKYRISTALSLLQNTTLSITEIALSTGFNSSSYFSKIFREHMKVTPFHYRKNNKKSE